MNYKSRPKFDIKIDLIRKEFRNEILIEKETKVKNSIINSIDKNILILKGINDLSLFGYENTLNATDKNVFWTK